MKIAFVCGHLHYGGVERVVQFLAKNFVERNFDVTIITTIEDNCPFTMDARIKHYQLKCSCGNKFERTLGRILDFNNFIYKNNFDVVISLGNNAYRFPIIAKFLKKKAFKLILSERSDPEREPINKIWKRTRDIGYHYADIVVCQTPDAAKYYKKLGLKNLAVISNPVRKDLPKPYYGERKKEIVNFCRLSPQKNLYLLIDAFMLLHEEYPEFILKIYGEGELKNEIQSYILDKNMESIILLEDFCYDIHDKIKDCYMFVSSSDYEGISNSMLEAMSIGLPVVCTDCPVGGARMVIENNVNGQIVPVGDKIQLYEAMKKYIEDFSFYRDITSKSPAIRDKYSEDRICDKWVNVIQKVKSYE